TGQIIQEDALIGSEAKDGFAETVDAVGGGLEGLGNGIVRITGDDDLDWVMCEERSSEAIGGGEETVLRSDAGEGFERFFSESTVAPVSGKGVHSNERDGGAG